MLTWSHLPYFLAAARTGSLRAAAEALGSTHATTRRQVDALEARLGTALFVRSRRGLVLTEAGRRLLAEAEAAERHVAAGETRVRGLGRTAVGLIRLSAEPLIARVLLAPILARISRRYPEIDFEIRLADDFEDVAAQAADVALRHAPDVGPGVRARRLFPLTVATYGRRDDLAETLPGAGPAGEGLTRIGGGGPGRGGGGQAGHFPAARRTFESPDMSMRLELAMAGAGLAVLPTWVETRYPELAALPGSRRETSRATWLVVNEDLARVPRVRIFADDLARALTAAGAAVRPG